MQAQKTSRISSDPTLTVLSPEEFDIGLIRDTPLAKRRRGNQGTKHKREYRNLVTAFDIETTALLEIGQSVMYVWQWAIGPDIVVIGRTWDEFKAFRDRLVEALGDTWLVVYVHNLSYEFAFLSGIYDFQPDEVMAMAPHKILKCEMSGHLEFRCSYLQTNMSLDAFTKQMAVEHQKLSGDDFDYAIKRYPWTPLSDQEIAYCVNDVVGLVEAITVELQMEGDTLHTIPLTSTGYVRRDAKRAMRVKVRHDFVRSIQPDTDTYLQLRQAFRGGNTHANRYYAGKIIEDVSSADRASSYPDVLCNRRYPVTAFFNAPNADIKDVTRWITVRGRAVLCDIALYNVRLRNPFWGCPYISKDKCRNLIGREDDWDNGRVLHADYLETSVTDIDLTIIMQEYDFDSIEVRNAKWARYGKLPEAFRECIKDYYIKKTTLKGDPEQDYYYARAKAKLNSLYGMTAQSIKPNMLYMDGDFTEEDTPIDELVNAHNAKAFLPYQWGVWCTAWARWELEEAIRLVHEAPDADFVYTDTDSVKYVGTVDFSALNDRYVERSNLEGATACDRKGIWHPMGVYEDDGHYDRFCTLGAKKYCYEINGKVHVTVSGVNKLKGGEELGKIENFKDGFIFREAGGTEIIYNSHPEIDSIDIDGHTLPITANACIRPSTYTLGTTAGYKRLIEDAYRFKKALEALKKGF